MMPKRSERRGPNLFDLAVLLAVALAIVATLWFAKGRRTGSGSGTEVAIVYRVELEKLSEAVKNNAAPGGAVRDGVRKTPLGEITGVHSFNTPIVKNDAVTGAIVRTAPEGRYSVVLTCEARGRLVNGRILIGDYVMAVGTAVSLQSETISGTGYCISLVFEELS